MGLLEIFLTGVGLSMDAFAVSVCKGLEQKKLNVLNMFIIALFFGFFQFAMPVIAYFCCKDIAVYIESFDHWIAFVLLLFIGVKMIIESIVEYKKEKANLIKANNFTIDNNAKQDLGEGKKNKINNTLESNLASSNDANLTNKENDILEETKQKLNIKELFVLAVATSIDALVVGITLAFTNTNIFLASGIIGIVTFVICCAGVLIGKFFGSKLKTSAGIIGGIILVLIGVKILLEHLGVLVF